MCYMKQIFLILIISVKTPFFVILNLCHLSTKGLNYLRLILYMLYQDLKFF